MDIERLKDLITKREEIDAQIMECVGQKEKKKNVCGRCGEPGHSVRTCARIE